MKIGIASHIVIDTIKNPGDNATTQSLGGPPCYCGITARRFGLDVELATMIGSDFPEEYRNFLRSNSITLRDFHISNTAHTTQFRLELANSDTRELFLESKCEPIPYEQVKNMKVDCWLISPVIDEVPMETFEAIKMNRGKKNFVMLDPQGYTRKAVATEQGDAKIYPADGLDIDLSGITAIKVGSEEMATITGGLQGLDGMRSLQSRGIEFVLSTENRIVHLLHEAMHYWIKLDNIATPDSTGAGDILSSAFAIGYVKEKDPLWALCFGAGALRAALETKDIGLEKIPPLNKIESSASYFYNTVSFKHL